MRQFIRHPVDVPIEIRTDRESPVSTLHTHDVSCGGLALYSASPAEPGSHIHVRISCVQPPFEARARVVWCQPGGPEGYELGVAFLEAEDAFLARMVEQVCYIEDYRLMVLRTEGRELSMDEAAAEWIRKFAAEFPDIGHSGMH